MQNQVKIEFNVSETFSLRPHKHNLTDYTTKMATCVKITIENQVKPVEVDDPGEREVKSQTHSL